MDITTLTLAKKYANGIASGISSYAVDGLTLKITTTSGQVLTMQFPSPKVEDIDISADGYITFTLEDGTEITSDTPIPVTAISAQPNNALVKKDDGLYVPTSQGGISSITTTGSGNAITNITANDDTLTVTKDKTFLTTADVYLDGNYGITYHKPQDEETEEVERVTIDLSGIKYYKSGHRNDINKEVLFSNFYTKPETGIPKSDLNISIQTNLNDAIHYTDINCKEWDANKSYTKGSLCYITMPVSTLYTEKLIFIALKDNIGVSVDDADTWAVYTSYINNKADKSDIPNIIDNLTSTSSTDALSANQGRVLKDYIDEQIGGALSDSY